MFIVLFSPLRAWGYICSDLMYYLGNVMLPPPPCSLLLIFMRGAGKGGMASSYFFLTAYAAVLDTSTTWKLSFWPTFPETSTTMQRILGVAGHSGISSPISIIGPVPSLDRPQGCLH